MAAITSRKTEHLHHDLVKVWLEAEKRWEASGGANVFLTCTWRNNEAQTELYKQGRENKKGAIVTWALAGQSPHNFNPSFAFDIAFLKADGKSLDWNRSNFIGFAKVFQEVAAEMEIKIPWGADWNNDRKIDLTKTDLPHFQLTDWKKLA
jgi:peptidoglycan L-alanyl-D-glutamate endopeptidase CwlK